MIRPAYPVFWTHIAEADLRAIIAFISLTNPHNAIEIFKKIKDSASSLNSLPERGRIVPELQDQGIWQYRELVVAPWRMIYRIAEHGVYILSLLDSRQNVEDILLKRLSGYDRHRGTGGG
ncbi:type II toxin-antitoxin system RelE/ParE family toxin [Desulfatirhabdium butyrativorans]|uniref:type II toxin-antitoxin system RelE/ParE family toxin n=1 Tax=Desulfatirhabdium butyrativorans TaxID=340467 RepID=UPI0003FC2730|nr:type II toxin-antitoxin system RelE/ParE family toxin [Desulfatirhabdium butyrativorans]